jgi:hypothetical protein
LQNKNLITYRPIVVFNRLRLEQRVRVLPNDPTSDVFDRAIGDRAKEEMNVAGLSPPTGPPRWERLCGGRRVLIVYRGGRIFDDTAHLGCQWKHLQSAFCGTSPPCDCCHDVLSDPVQPWSET